MTANAQEKPMLYALLIYQDEELVETLSTEEHAALIAQHNQLQADTKLKGTFAAATQLMPSATATTVSKKADKTRIHDGPFGESKELFVGFYVFDCESLDKAIEYAERIPHVSVGSVEIRPIAFSESLPVNFDSKK
jgi:hypothetical protein